MLVTSPLVTLGPHPAADSVSSLKKQVTEFAEALSTVRVNRPRTELLR